LLLAAGFGIVLCSVLVLVYEHREDDRQPATTVVAMPVRMMAVIDIPKHYSAAYTRMLVNLSNNHQLPGMYGRDCTI
jgi:hypothetical protein